MANFVDPVKSNEAVAVGVLSTAVLAAEDCRGHDSILITITNESVAETFNGTASSSPTGTGQWADVPDDTFQTMLPGETRSMSLPSDKHLFVRVLGAFVGAPDTVTLTVRKLRAAVRRA